MNSLLNIVGIVAILGVMYALSNNKKAINKMLVIKALALQFVIAFICVKFPAGVFVVEQISNAISKVLSYAKDGLMFVFGSLADPSAAAGFIFIISVLGNIIFIGALVSVFFYTGILSFIIKRLGWLINKVIGTSDTESFICVGNIFLGQTESPLLVSKYLPSMTNSEIMMILISGMGSMSVSILGGYNALGIPVQHLVIASILVPMGAIAIGKILYPETEFQMKNDDLEITTNKGANIVEAVTNGAMDGMQMIIAIAASLAAIISMVGLCNGILANFGITLQQILGWFFYPVAFLLGVDDHMEFAAQLLGCKMVMNEFISFEMLGKVISTLDPRTALVLSVSQAGFANIGSMGVCIGALGSLCPTRKTDVSRLIVKALIGAFFVSVMNAMFVGLIMSF